MKTVSVRTIGLGGLLIACSFAIGLATGGYRARGAGDGSKERADPGANEPVSQADVSAQGLPTGSSLSETVDLLNAILVAPLVQLPGLAQQLGDTRESLHLRSALFTRWADLDPEGLVDYSVVRMTGMKRALALQMGFEVWADRDISSALVRLKAIPEGIQRDYLLSLIQSDEGAFEEKLRRQLGSESGDKDVIVAILLNLSKVDPRRAAEIVMEAADKSVRNYYLDGVLREWSKSNFDEARKWLLGSFNEGEQVEALQRLFSHLVESDPKEAMKRIDEFPDGLQKNGLIEMIAFRLFNDDPAQAQQWTEERLGSVQRVRMNFSFLDLALQKGDVALAESYFDLLPYGGGRDAALMRMAEKKAALNPVAAEQWLSSLDATDYARAAPSVLASLAMTNPQYSATKLLSMTGNVREEAMAGVLKAWAGSDPGAALSWINALEGPEKLKAQELIVGTWSNLRPDQASSYVQAVDDLQQKARLMDGLAEAWARSDPQAAGKFFAEASDESSTHAVRILVALWTANDSMAASAWARELERGPTFDAASRQIAESIVSSDPRSAAMWALEIDNTTQREEVLSGVLKYWASQNKAQALEAVKEMKLMGRDQVVAESIFR